MRDFKEHPEHIESRNIKQKIFVECLNKIAIFNERIPCMEFRKNGHQSAELYLSLKDLNVNKEKDVYSYILGKLKELSGFHFNQPNKQDNKELIEIIDQTNPEHHKRIGIILYIYIACSENATNNICHLSIDISSSLTCLYLEIGTYITDKTLRLGEVIKVSKPKLSNKEKNERRERKKQYKEWIDKVANSSEEELDNLINKNQNTKYDIGEKLLITNGSFKGLIGLIKSVNAETLEVELNIFDMPVIVEVNVNDTIPRHIYFLKECLSQQKLNKDLYGESKVGKEKNSTEWLREETIKKLKDESYYG